MRIDEALSALAEEAPDYADADRAIGLARRRRTRRWVWAGCVALAVLAVTALVVPRQQHVVVPVGPPSALPGTTRYPVAVSRPTDPAVLPADRAVGPAAFAYTSRETGALLVMTDGRQYLLPASDALEGDLDSLSPDGHWLLLRSKLRDLTSTTTRTVPAGRASWSPQGRWLLIDTGAGPQYVVDTGTGSTRPVHGAVAVLDTGDIVVPTDIRRKVATLTVVDPATGIARRRFTVDATAALPRPDDGIGITGGEFSPSLYGLWPAGDHGYLMVKGGADLTVLVVSLIDGRVLNSQTLPADQHGYQYWAVAGVDSGLLVLREERPLAPSPSTATLARIALADMTGPPPTIVCQLPSHVSLLARGAAVPI